MISSFIDKHLIMGLVSIIGLLGAYVVIDKFRIDSLKKSNMSLEQTIVDMGNAFNTELFNQNSQHEGNKTNEEVNTTLSNTKLRTGTQRL